MHLTKALADPSRVRVLLALQAGELCVCQISELLGLAPSTVSKHLSILHHAGLIESRKTERWVHCRLPGRTAPPHVRDALAWVRSTLADAPEVKADRLHLHRILRIEPATLCQRQRRV